jgi:EAL domain-containing protein (putative c-di-GMP-specific phosphodiesterase class I)
MHRQVLDRDNSSSSHEPLVMLVTEEIAQAIKHGQMFLHYLPTVSLTDSHCSGAEALVRWRRRRAVLPAGAFIPLIENTPVSGMMTYWVIDSVAEELGVWLDENPAAHISINVPPEILGRGGLAYAAMRSGLHSRMSQVMLEITERGVPDRLGFEALRSLAERGVRLALDDTSLSGTNLALLSRCEFAVVKLDRQLTWQLEPDHEKPTWFNGLEALLKNSAVQVIAEGVETEYQAEQLKNIGVQMAQGYFFSPPLSARQLMQFYVDKAGPQLAS